MMMDTILIIEDNKDVSLMLAEALTDAGYKVLSAYTGIEGLNQIKNETYDLVYLILCFPIKVEMRF
jgi:DNA-binding response OmpR family regulator